MKKISQPISEAYQKYCAAEGNHHIASEYAIHKLWEIKDTFQLKDILEIGLGIGSICGSFLEADRITKEITYEGTESNLYCLSVLPVNLGFNYKRLKIYNTITSIPAQKRYDLVIIDGKDLNIVNIKQLISENGIIAIEGDRIPQQELLQEIFPNHIYVHSISDKKNQIYSPFPIQNWQGGLKIIFTSPTLKQNLWWCREKVLTKLKYFYRKRIYKSAEKPPKNSIF